MSDTKSSIASKQSYRSSNQGSRSDIIGILLLVVTGISLLLGIIAVSTIYSWDSPQVLGSFLAASELIIVFLIHAQFTNRPILRLKRRHESAVAGTISSDSSPAYPVLVSWPNLALIGILLLVVYLNLVQITQNGFGNIYYASTIKSMSMSWHNFFFVAFEPGGSIAMDKPPISLWLQTASVTLFGFNSLSLVLPLELAALASVALLFHLVRRTFGVSAGLLAALFLALTPASVVASRATTMDGMLTLDLLFTAWAFMKAAETGYLRWLLLGGALLGLGFNIKMMEAYLVLPAFILLYLLASPRPRLVRIGHILLAILVLFAVSFSWSLIVDSVAASQRPFVGSSGNNTELGLGLGYNGIGRPLGQILGLAVSGVSKASSGANLLGELYTLSGGPTRLFFFLGDQVNWLLPLALLGLLTTIWQRRDLSEDASQLTKRRFSRSQQSLLCWLGWFVVQAIFFTVYVLIHAYYLTIFAPSVAALAGVGVLGLWRDYRGRGWRGWLLPIALLLTALYQALLIVPFPGYNVWLLPIIVIALLLISVLLIWLRITRAPVSDEAFRPASLSTTSGWSGLLTRLTLPGIVTAAGIIVALLASATWSVATTQNASNGLVPVAGPMHASDSGIFVILVQGVGDYASVDPHLVDYLQANRSNARYLVATSTSLAAAPFVVQSGQAVLPLGGFNGNDKIFSVDQLASLVNSGQVRYFWLAPFFLSPAQIDKLDPRLQKILRELYATEAANPNDHLLNWVSSHCQPLAASQWGGSDAGGAAVSGAPQLYDCANSH